MCTLLVRYAPGERWPVLAGAVRDEFTQRPWDPPGAHWNGAWSGLVGGRDRVAGGTWLAVDRDRRALAALLNGVRRPEPPGGAARPTRGTLALDALAGRTPDTLDIGDHDGFHVVRATLDGVEMWSWDGDDLVHRPLSPGDHILVNGGLDTDDPLVPHFLPLLHALPTPQPQASATTEAAWGPWLEVMAGAGLDHGDERALIVRREVEGRTYGSTSASLVALSEQGVRYDFNAAPADGGPWVEIVGPEGIEPSTERL